ncbi:histidine phosphatase family protein [Dyadobacter frigoris]|uniref:Histidine phosphatase family protein n=2 Tax=Dyadobacter frigoris TaxID=2576211 RepID=A0A4U6D9I8_9BACT|nr:histidine phosphatase family protein [Dyadobacter frigoris]
MECSRDILLIRHPQSLANIDRSICRHVRDFDVEISILGYAQTSQCVNFIKNSYFNNKRLHIYHSPFIRTKYLADRLALSLSSPKKILISESRKIEELCFGAIKGLSMQEWAYTYPKNYSDYLTAKANNEKLSFCYPQGESLVDVYQRILEFKFQILDKESADTIIIVSHDIPLKILYMILCNKKLKQYFHIPEIPNVGVHHFTRKEGTYYHQGLIFQI